MAARPLNIIHCLRAPVGGLFRHVRDLATAQAQAGHAVGIVCDMATGGMQATEALDELASLCTLGIERFSISRLPGLGDLPALMRIGRMGRDLGADILHGHGAKGGAYARLACAGRPPRRFYTPHGGSLHYGRASPYLMLERLLLRRTDGLIFESAYGERAFRAKVARPACPARVIHNGLRAEDFQPVRHEADASDILFVGELRHLKGVATLLEALALLARGGRDLSATVVGDGPDADHFKAMAREHGLARSVRFAGALPARRAFALGRLLVVPSLAESFPYIVLEAVAAGMPLIATDAGGIGEIFGAEASRLIRPGDARALAAAIVTARRDAGAMKAVTARLRAHARASFTVEGMAAQIEAFYRAALTAGA